VPRDLSGRRIEDFTMSAGRRDRLAIDPKRNGFELNTLGRKFGWLIH
jgi:hypothetical protein